MATNLVITLPPELEGALNELARKEGIAPEALIIDALRDRLVERSRAIEPRDDWERLILQAGTNCGVSLPDEALSSEGLYE
jgi:predicted transcriptional regulator